MRRYISNLMIPAIALVLLVSGDAFATQMHRSGDNFKVTRSDLKSLGGGYVESTDMLFNVQSVGKLLLGTTHGSVSVRTWDSDKVRLVVNKRTDAASELDARRIFGMFRVQAMHGGKGLRFTGRARTEECARNVGVTFTVWVPRSYALEIKTDQGDIEIPEMNGRFSAHTSDGTITVDCDTEDLDIEVEDHTQDDGGEEEVGAPTQPEESTDSGSGTHIKRDR